MDPKLCERELTSSTLGQSLPLLPDLESGIGKSAAMLGLSAGIEGAMLQLQNLHIEEQKNSKKHRTNFQTLEAEHTILQEEFARTQGELRRLLSDKQAQQEKFQLLLTEQRDNLLDKNRELEELRRQVMTPQRLELLRAEMQQEMEAPVREQFDQLEEEMEKYRSEYYKLRYENNLLQSQMEDQRQESALILETTRSRYEAELCYVKKEQEDLVAQYRGSEAQRDGKRMETLLGERVQLHLRVKGLEAEAAELRAQKNNLGQRAESDLRLQTRQLSEAQALLKMMEAERQSLQQELERTGSELHLSHEQNGQLTGKLHRAEREVNSLTFQIQSLKHSHQQEIASVKLECARSKEELERERVRLQNHIDGLQDDVEVLETTLKRHKEVLVEKERALVRTVQSAQRDAVCTTVALHEEKLMLETRLAELEQQRVQEDASDYAQKEEREERLRKALQGEESAHREVQHLRNKLHQQSSQLDELEGQRAEITGLQLQKQELSIQVATLSHSQSGLMETNQRLKEALRTAQAQTEKNQHEAERLLEERRVDWLEDKHKVQEHDAELQQKYSRLKEKLQRAAAAQKKRKTLTENTEKRLQDKIQLLEAKVEELELEAALAQKRLSSSGEPALLKRQLKKLQQRHNEFQCLLLSGQCPVSLGPAPLTSSHNPLVVFGPGGLSSTGTEELSVLRQRLDNVESAQQQQLQKLGSLDQRDRGLTAQPDL